MITTVSFQDHEVLQLSDGDSRILISPAHGARLLNWEIGERPVIFWPQEADWSQIANVRGGNPILFPFIGRHMIDGKIGYWRDKDGSVRALPMHGFAREMEYRVLPSDENTVHMRLESNEATRAMYPFDFRFDVVYRLTRSTLETRLETTNTGEQVLPYYAGHHFYFALPHTERAQWTLDLPCRQWGKQDFSTGDINFREADEKQTSINGAEWVDRMNIDTGERITLQNPTQNRRLEILLDESTPIWHAVTTWTESDQSDFYCIEPWLGLPNAIHHGHGLRRLAPGETESAICSIDAGGW